jgi:hypothetical protein
VNVSGLLTNASLAVGFNEVNTPEIAVMLEVEQDAVHGGIVGQQTADAASLVVDGFWSAKGCVSFEVGISLAHLPFAHPLSAFRCQTKDCERGSHDSRRKQAL